ncbi:MAG: PEPxxWA-CTERM sorting domain-containing protein [Caulobacteraceae bacterium]
MQKVVKSFAGVAAAVVAMAMLPAAASAQAFSVSVTVDENGHGALTNTSGFESALPWALQNDPGPGGLNNVLTYDLLNPPGLVAGDVLLQDGVGGPILDVLRFNPTETVTGTTDAGSLVFYSDNVDGFDSLGDTSGPPTALYTNSVTIQEVGSEGNNGAIYTPIAGQPGFVAGAAGPVIYDFISDSVPEPASWALMMVGVGAVGFSLRRRAKALAAA